MHSNMPWVRRRRSHALLCLCGAALLLAASANPFGRREGLSTLLHDNAEHDAEQAPVPGSGWRSSPSYCSRPDGSTYPCSAAGISEHDAEHDAVRATAAPATAAPATTTAKVPNRAEFGAREGVVTNLHDEAGGDTPLLAVVRRAWQHLQALDGRKYENRTAAGFDREVLPRLGFGTPGGPSQFRTCSCCCCDPLVTGISVFERPSEKLDTLLSKHGVEGCHELAAARMAVDSKIIHKSAGGHIIRHGSLRGQPVVIVTCGSRGCASKGVGTMLAKRQSPFVVDLVGYCPPGGTGFPSGALVMEQMTSGGHRWMGVAYPWAWAFDNSAGMPAGPVKLQLLNVALGIIGGMKDYHSLGRLGADIGPHQWMGSADGRVKIMDVDCRPEAYVQNIIWSSRDEKDKFTRTNEANPNYKDSCPKPDRSQWWSNGRQLDATQRRDVVLVAILLCNLLPPQRETCLDRGSTAHDLGVGHGERHGRCDAKVELSSTQVKRLQRLYQRAHNKGDLDIRLDDLVSEFVDVLGLSGVIEGSARF